MLATVLSFLALLALPASIAKTSPAEVLENLPECTLDCLLEDNNYSCLFNSDSCICNNGVMHGKMSGCILVHCSVKDLLITKNVTDTACENPGRNRSGQYITISNALGVISAIIVAERFAFKLYTKMDLGFDDWYTLATLLIGIPKMVLNEIELQRSGIGRDIWTVSFDDIPRFGYQFYLMEILYFVQIAFIKVALLFLYLRIFPTPNVRRVLWGSVIVTHMFAIAFLFAAVFQCKPVSFYWHRWDGEHQGSCLDISAITWSNAAVSVALDLWIISIPLLQIKKLRLTTTKKIWVSLAFLFGTFFTIISILRFRSLLNFGRYSVNPTWDYFNVGTWSTIEVNVGIWCACMPTMRLTFNWIVIRLVATAQWCYLRLKGYTGRAARRPYFAKITSSSVGNTPNSTGEASSTWPESGERVSYKQNFGAELGDRDGVELTERPTNRA